MSKKEFIKPIVVLSIICIVTVAALAVTYQFTLPYIEAANAGAAAEAMKGSFRRRRRALRRSRLKRAILPRLKKEAKSLIIVLFIMKTMSLPARSSRSAPRATAEPSK